MARPKRKIKPGEDVIHNCLTCDHCKAEHATNHTSLACCFPMPKTIPQAWKYSPPNVKWSYNYFTGKNDISMITIVHDEYYDEREVVSCDAWKRRRVAIKPKMNEEDD